MRRRKQAVPYWACTPLPGCYSIAVVCVLNAHERLVHHGFYGISRQEHDDASETTKQQLWAVALQTLQRGLIASIRKELERCADKN